MNVSLSTIVSAHTASYTTEYQKPDDCHWSSQVYKDDEPTLICQFRAINIELDHTNFSIIPPRSTTRLRLECTDDQFFQHSLSPGSFRHLIELRSLQVVNCKIGNLSNNAFSGLRNLVNLTIQTHNTEWSAMGLDIDRDAFNTVDLAALQRLDMSENNMWTVPPGVFCTVYNLEYLNLTKNRLHEVENLHMSANRKCLQNLLVLDLSMNNIERIGSNWFSGLKNLEELLIQNNRLNSIADAAFEGLSSLRVIRLNGNNLYNLPPELFNATKQLQEVYIQNNSLNILAPGIFSGLSHLVVLDLSKNQLTSEWVNSLTLRGLNKLAILDLSENKLTKIDTAMFKDLKNIQVLRINDNHVRHIQERAFEGLSNMYSLSLSNNRLFSLDMNVFAGLNGLRLLSIDFNRISRLNAKVFINLTQLGELHLNGNKLEQIPEGLLDMTSLSSVDLGENRIKTLINASFTGMAGILGLRLTENFIEAIKIGMFDKMVALQILNLSRNKITHIEKGAFDKNRNLQAIRLDGNYLKDLTGLFTKLPNLVWLNASENQLESFDYSMIPTQLQWLDIHANRVEKLGNYFEIEAQLSLSTFDASSNRLTEITGNSIPNSVDTLYLKNNLIEKVQPYTFFKKPNITRVDLTGNKITTLDPNALRISAVPKDRPLPEFFIGGNPYLCDCNLDWLQRVGSEQRNQPKIMDLTNASCKLLYSRGRNQLPLVETQPHQFLCKYESHCMSLCHCCSFNSCDCKMQCPDRCTCYHDQTWSSNIVDCSRSSYDLKIPDQIPMESTQLYLDGNNFPEIPSLALIGRRKLRILFLNNSNVEIIHNRTFFSLDSLEILNLAKNHLRQLFGYEFEGLMMLREIHLEDNQITQIHSETFSNLYKLRKLRLDNNQLVSFDFTNIPNSVSDLRLSENPWMCDCEKFDELKQFISRDIVKDKHRIKCFQMMSQAIIPQNSSGSEMQQRNDSGFFIININISNVCQFYQKTSSISGQNATTKAILSTQTVHYYIPLLVTTLSGLFLIILITLLIFIFRQEVRVWFHSRFGIRLFYRDTTANDKHERDKLFDAFISYSSKDEAFVVEHLAPVLENEDPQYKLCLHYRDFPVGAYIADTIVQAIDSSRRTIMILSKNFIKSEWCRFEFKSAHHQVLRDRRRRLIVILLGDVPQKDLDPDIRLYLKTNTYLQWGDKLFWQKLRFALPDVYNNQRQHHHHHQQHIHHQHQIQQQLQQYHQQQQQLQQQQQQNILPPSVQMSVSRTNRYGHTGIPVAANTNDHQHNSHHNHLLEQQQQQQSIRNQNLNQAHLLNCVAATNTHIGSSPSPPTTMTANL